jgi:6-phosphogluconolactonase (cycloisomerase 2 family)
MIRKVPFQAVALSFLLCVSGAGARGWAQSGGFIYLLNTPSSLNNPPGSILGFSIDANTGTLTPIPGPPVQAHFPDPQLAVSPSGRFLYALEFDSGTGYAIAGFSIKALVPACLRPFLTHHSQPT